MVLRFEPRCGSFALFFPFAGLNPAGAYAVYPYFRTQADGQRMAEGDHASFGGRVRFRVRLGLNGPGGGDVHDGAAALAKMICGVFRAQETPRQVDIENPMPLLQRELRDRHTGRRDPCIADENVESPEMLDR